jgi:hypothetical protein
MAMRKQDSIIPPKTADKLAESLRKKLRVKLGKLPEQVIIEFGKKPRKPGIATGTDWPDSFNRDRWYNTWARGSGKVVLPAATKTPE